MMRNLSLSLLLACASIAASAQERGYASYYADKFHGRKTASGKPYHKDSLTAAHRTAPFGSYLRVTSVKDPTRSVVVKVTDRGPFVRGRVVDVSRAAAEALDMIRYGVVEVEVSPWDTLPAGAQIVDSQVYFNTPAAAPSPSTGLFMVTAAIPAEGFAIQAGAYEDAESALLTIAAFQRDYLLQPLLHVGTAADGKPVFRVLIGPYPGRPQADSALLTLSQQNFSGFVISLQNLR